MKRFRMILDVVMTLLFIILMGYYATENEVHEILGTITFILFVIHHVLNIKWYKSIFNERHNFQRLFHIILNLLLLIAMVGMMVSGIMISADVFAFLDIPTTMFGRRLHLISTSWGFVLMAIHVGLHITALMQKLNSKMKNSTFEYVYYFILVLLVGLGIYSFVNLRVWEDMFLVNDFKFFDYYQSPLLFYLKYVAVLIAIALAIYAIFSLIRKVKIMFSGTPSKNSQRNLKQINNINIK